jgi:hypothetical protein
LGGGLGLCLPGLKISAKQNKIIAQIRTRDKGVRNLARLTFLARIAILSAEALSLQLDTSFAWDDVELLHVLARVVVHL